MSEQRLERTLERAGKRSLDDVKFSNWCVELPETLERWLNVPYLESLCTDEQYVGN